jgi:tRNA(Arg) A34 adenosine deaminase TadA
MASKAESHGEVPVGAVIVKDNQVIGAGFNRSIMDHDPTAHAELVSLRDAAQKIENYRISGATLYVTLEPCMMCVGAMVHARIDRLVYGASDPKSGVVDSCGQLLASSFLNHTISITPEVLADECGQQLSNFFKARRQMKSADKKRDAS